MENPSKGKAKEAEKFKVLSDVDDFLGVDYDRYSDGEDLSDRDDDNDFDEAEDRNISTGKSVTETEITAREREIESRKNENRIFDLEKKLLEDQIAVSKETIRQLKARLIRRTSLVDEIRSSYIRDVVIIKQVLETVLSGSEKEAVVKEYTANLPSLDLREQLSLRAPKNCELRVTPCETCGGKVEAVLADPDEVVKLKGQIDVMKKREERFRIQIAELDAIMENTTRQKSEIAHSHGDEKKVLYAEMTKLRQESEKKTIDADSNAKIMKKMRAEIQSMKDQLAEAEHMNVELAEARAELRKQRNIMEADNQELRLSQEKLSQSMHENASLRLELHTISGKYNTVSEAYELMKAGTDNQVKHIQKLEHESSLNNMEKIILNKKILDLDETLESTRLELETLKKLYKRLEISLDAAKSDHDSTTQLMRSHQETLIAEIEHVTNQLVTATKGINEKESLIEAAKNQIHSLKLDHSQSTIAATVAIESIMKNSQYLSGHLGGDSEVVQVTFTKSGEKLASSLGTQTESTDSATALVGTRNQNLLTGSGSKRKKPRRRRSIPFSCKFGIEIHPLLSTVSLAEGGDTEAIDSVSFTQGIDVPVTNKQSAVVSQHRKSSKPLALNFPAFRGVHEPSTVDRSTQSSPHLLHQLDASNGQNSPLSHPDKVNYVDQSSPIKSHTNDASSDGIADLQKLRLHDSPSADTHESKQSDTARTTMSNATEMSVEENTFSSAVDESTEDNPSASISSGALQPRDKDKSTKKSSYISVEKSVLNEPRNKEKLAAIPAGKSEAPAVAESKSASAETPKIILPKKKPTAFKEVKLLPLTADATAAERAIRESLLAGMKQDPDLTQNISHKVVNVLIPTIKKYSAVLNASFESVWRALLLNGDSLDYLCGVAQVFDEVILQSKRKGTLAEVEAVRSSTAAALEQVAHNKLRLFTSWKNEIEFDEGLLKALDKQNNDTSGVMLFVDYFIAPHSQRGPKDLLENKMLSATEATLESVRNLITCSENIRERLTSEFKDTLHDWASAKSVFVDMERLIEVEKEKVRNDLGAKIAKLGDDLVLKQNMYERKCDQMDVLEGHISDLKLMVRKLAETEKKLDAADKENSNFLNEVQKLTHTIDDLKGKLEATTKKLNEGDDQIKKLKQSLKTSVEKCKSEGESIVLLNAQVTAMTKEKDDWQARYVDTVAKDVARLAGMVAIGCQIYPSTASVNLQTEFLTLPTDLHMMTSGSLDRLGKAKYPLPLVHCSSPVKSTFDNHSVSSESANNRTSTALAAALNNNSSSSSASPWAGIDDDDDHFAKPILGLISSSDSLQSSRSGVSSISSVSSLTNSTKGYDFYNASSMRRMNSHKKMSFGAPQPSYDLKSFLGGPSLAPSVKQPIALGAIHHSYSDDTSKAGMKSPSIVSSSGNSGSVKFRPSTDGKNTIIPLTIEYQKKRKDANASGTISPLKEFQIGLPMAKKVGATEQGMNNDVPTSRSVNLLSGRGDQGGAQTGGESNVLAPTVTLSSISLSKAKKDFLSMV